MRAAAILSFTLLLGACHVGNAEGGRPTARRDFPVGGFDRIALAGSSDVIVMVGGAPSVRAEGDAEAIERLEIGVEGGQLRVGTRSGSGHWFSFGRHRGVTVHVTVPALAAAEIGGSGDMRIDRVQAARFAASIGGSGDMEVANLRAGEASFAVTGSGGIRAAGSAQRASLSLTGSGDLDLARLEAADATIALVGSGDISVRATGTAQVELSGSGDVTVAGPAHCTISKAGSGDVRCGG